MKRVEAIVRPEKLEDVLLALEDKGYVGSTVGDVRGHGRQAMRKGSYRGRKFELHVIHKLLIEIVCEDHEVQQVVDTIIDGARTGTVGDGIVMVSDLAAVYQIRTGAGLARAAAAGSTGGPNGASAPWEAH